MYDFAKFALTNDYLIMTNAIRFEKQTFESSDTREYYSHPQTTFFLSNQKLITVQNSPTQKALFKDLV